MKKSFLSFSIIMTVLINFYVASTAFSQDHSCRYEKVGQVPLQDIVGFLLVTIYINGQPFNMVVDTGSEGSLISPEGAKILRLPVDPSRQTVVQGPRGGQELVRNVIIQQLNLGQLKIGPWSMPLGNLPSYPRLNPPVIGLIGGDILSNFDVEFDVQDKKMTFWRVHHNSVLCQIPPFWGDKMQQVPMQMDGHRPLIKVKVNQFSLMALLDSGARSRIISFQKVLKMGVSYSKLTSSPGGIASGVDMRSTRYYWHRFKSFQVGQDIEYNPTLTVSPMHDSVDMLIGSDWFSGRKVWVSYSRHMLYFIKNMGKE